MLSLVSSGEVPRAGAQSERERDALRLACACSLVSLARHRMYELKLDTLLYHRVAWIIQVRTDATPRAWHERARCEALVGWSRFVVVVANVR